MLNVPVLVAPAVSRTLTLMVLKVPAAVGVPLTVMVLPLSDAVRPAGSPVTVRLLNGPVPVAIPIVPLYPAWLTVQAEVDNAPNVGAALTVMLNVPVLVAPAVSRTVSSTLP